MKRAPDKVPLGFALALALVATLTGFFTGAIVNQHFNDLRTAKAAAKAAEAANPQHERGR